MKYSTKTEFYKIYQTGIRTLIVSVNGDRLTATLRLHAEVSHIQSQRKLTARGWKPPREKRNIFIINSTLIIFVFQSRVTVE